MRQQIRNRYLTHERCQNRILGPAARINLCIGKFGYKLRHRIVQLQLALFVEHHNRNTGNRFGHRINAEKRILRHRLIRFPIAQTRSLEMHNLALSGDQRQNTCKLPRIHECLHCRLDLRKTLCRKPHLCGISLGNLSRKNRMERQKSSQQSKQATF